MGSRIPVFSFLPFHSMHPYPDLSVQIHIALFFYRADRTTFHFYRMCYTDDQTS